LLKHYKEYIKIIQSNGISIIGGFILGLQGDTLDNIKAIRDFVIETNIFPQYTVLTPFPGTNLYEEYKRENRLLENRDFSDYTAHDVVFQPFQETIEELEHAITWLHEETLSQRVNISRMKYMKNVYLNLNS